MRDVLILTSGQEEHPYVARNFRDHLEELAGSDLRVEVRELGQDGLQGWLMWLRERLAKRSKGGIIVTGKSLSLTYPGGRNRVKPASHE